jgi:hypothetical protein
VGEGSSEQLLQAVRAVCQRLDVEKERAVLAKVEALEGLLDASRERWDDAAGHLERSIHEAEDPQTYLDLGEAWMGELRASEDPVRRFILRQRIEGCCRQVIVIDLRDDHNRKAAALATLAGELAVAPVPTGSPHENGQVAAGNGPVSS